MDISETIIPKSDQLDAVDLVNGPQTFVIERVSKGNAEQPVNIHLQGFPRPWRPSKNMRRVLVGCWGKDASQYAGKAVRLYCDPNVMFGGQKVGGVRIEAVSHIDRPQTVPLLISRGKTSMYQVGVLPAPQAPTPPPEPTSAQVDQIMACQTVAELNTLWAATPPSVRPQITATMTARKNEIEGGQA